MTGKSNRCATDATGVAAAAAAAAAAMASDGGGGVLAGVSCSLGEAMGLLVLDEDEAVAALVGVYGG